MATDLQSFESDQGLFTVEGTRQRQHLITLLDQVDAGPAFEQVGQFAGQLHAGRPCSHDDQGRGWIFIL